MLFFPLTVFSGIGMFSSRNSHKGQPNAPLPRGFRLPKVSVLPSYTDIQFLHQEAEKVPGRLVEQPFSVTEGSQEYLLTVKFEQQIGLPVWTLSQMTNAGHQVIFQHAESDVSLVANIVLSGCGCDPLADSVADSFMGTESMSNLLPVGNTSVEAPLITNSDNSVIFDSPRPGMKATLEGDLTKMQAPTLLQSITMSKMTGRLDVKDRGETAKIYFVDGTPMHAELKDVGGDDAVIELITWTTGEFRFWPDETSPHQTVKRRLDSMLMEGVTLLDQSKYLESANMKMESILVKRVNVVSEQEFAGHLQKGAPLPIKIQLEIFELVDGKSTLFDLLRKKPMKKADYVPILFNLVSCGLIQLTDQVARAGNLRSAGIDEGALQSVTKHLVRQETGILTYPAFLYFLEQEYLRYEYFNFPFSLVVFSLGHRRQGPGGTVEALQTLAVKRAMQRISLVKRPIDLLGHYETFDFALILPNSNAKAAAALANRIVDVLKEAPLAADMDPRGLVFAFGVAGVPEDGQELDKLLNSARAARDSSKQSQRVVLAREIMSG